MDAIVFSPSSSILALIAIGSLDPKNWKPVSKKPVFNDIFFLPRVVSKVNLYEDTPKP